MSDRHSESLYARLGGYDSVVAVVENLLPRLMDDELLGRFWEHRGADGLLREKQLLIDFLCHSAGGPVYYTGRDMTTAHRGMRISATDWSRFTGHLEATLDHFELPQAERAEVRALVDGTRAEIVER